MKYYAYVNFDLSQVTLIDEIGDEVARELTLGSGADDVLAELGYLRTGFWEKEEDGPYGAYLIAQAVKVTKGG